jgi:voltage-gated potassium channel
MPDRPQKSDGPVVHWAERKFMASAMRPRNAAYMIALIWLVGVIVFAVVERLAEPETFTSIGLAFWWAMQTVTTVGYGDVVPTETSGKVMASILMLVGLSFLSIVTATVTSAFVTRRQAELREKGEDPVILKLNQISARLDAIEEELRRPPREGS